MLLIFFLVETVSSDDAHKKWKYTTYALCTVESIFSQKYYEFAKYYRKKNVVLSQDSPL